ncbi:MAG: VOC family protein [Candidatus Kapaibacterium sp.]
MSESSTSIGTIVWQDLTVENAQAVSNFYSEVVGWKAAPHNMGEYNDYNMQQTDGKTVAGVCHARGENGNIPPMWLIYITVEDVKGSAEKCVEMGGEVVDGPRMMGEHMFCIIRDPAGAVAALIGG